MKIRDLFNYVHKLKEDPFEDSELLVWLNEVEGLVHTKVFLLAPSEYKEITAADIDSDTFKLLIVGPHQKIYPAYLVAMIDFANGEYNRYANTLEMFNAHFTELQMWHRQYAGPADGECVFRGYYLSAYGIAKNRGVFNGSEEEWLASLKGEKGDSAYDIAVKLGYKGTEQEWIDYLAKAQSDAIDAARKSALEDIESCGEANRSLIDSAREIALRQIAEANDELSSNLGEYHSGLDDHYSHIAAELGSLRGDSIDEIAGAKTAAIDEIESTGSIFANALKGTASGEAIAITDASPIEHEMDVKVSGVSDISTVKVKKYGKNLLGAVGAPMFGNISNSVDIKHERTDTGLKYIGLKDTTITTQRVGYQVVPIETLKGKTLTISFKRYSQADDTNTSSCAILQAADAEHTDDYTYVGGNLTNRLNYRELQLKHAANGYFSYTLTIPENETRKNLFIIFYAGIGAVVSQGDVIEYADIQVELGNAATEYEPYIEPIEYPVSADGTVEGVTSVYPTTTLMTDTAGAVMDCTYNRDINKAFAELYNAIISTGGNV